MWCVRIEHTHTHTNSIAIIIIIYKTRTLWHSLSTHVYYYSFIMDRISVYSLEYIFHVLSLSLSLPLNLILYVWGSDALSSLASIIRSHRKNKIIKMKIRRTIQLHYQHTGIDSDVRRCSHINLYEQTICALHMLIASALVVPSTTLSLSLCYFILLPYNSVGMRL